MLTAGLSLIIAVIGLLVYVLSTKPETKELGRITYGMGLLAFLLAGGQQIITILGG